MDPYVSTFEASPKFKDRSYTVDVYRYKTIESI